MIVQNDPSEIIDEVFGEDSIMHRVAECESNTQQTVDGEPLWSYYGTRDVGLFQVHYPIWGEKAEEMGLDIIHSAYDNALMAKHIFEVQGISAWDPSRRCWSTN